MFFVLGHYFSSQIIILSMLCVIVIVLVNTWLHKTSLGTKGASLDCLTKCMFSLLSEKNNRLITSERLKRLDYKIVKLYKTYDVKVHADKAVCWV